MSFFVQIQKFLAFFTVFGLWSTWQNSKYKLLLRISSVISIAYFFILFSLSVIIDRFRDFNEISNIVSNVLFVLLFLTHFVILLESVLKNGAQAKLIKTLSEVDQLFCAKIGVAVPYRSEKLEIFIRLLILTLIEVIVKLAIILALLFSLNADKRFVFFTLYSNFISHLRLIQIVFFVYLVQSRLILLNVELIDILSLLNDRNCIQPIVNHKNNNKL